MSLQNSTSAILARAILHDRTARRKVGLQLLLVLVLSVVFGYLVIDGWLAKSLLLFSLYWMGVSFLMLMILLLAVYDALRVVKEERDKLKREL